METPLQRESGTPDDALSGGVSMTGGVEASPPNRGPWKTRDEYIDHCVGVFDDFYADGMDERTALRQAIEIASCWSDPPMTEQEAARLLDGQCTKCGASLSQGAPEPPLSTEPPKHAPDCSAVGAAVSRGPGPDWDHDLPSERELIAAFKPRLVGYMDADVTDEMLALGLKLGLHALRRVAASPARESKP